jgi:hypothetical protein
MTTPQPPYGPQRPWYPQPSPRGRGSRRNRNAILAIAGSLVILGAIALVLGGGKSPASSPAVPPSSPALATTAAPAVAAYTAELVSPRPYADPTFADTLDVNFTVTNVSKLAGTPVCTITASSPRGRYRGTDVLDEMDRIRAGQTIPMAAQVTISHRGARRSGTERRSPRAPARERLAWRWHSSSSSQPRTTGAWSAHPVSSPWSAPELPSSTGNSSNDPARKPGPKPLKRS